MLWRQPLLQCYTTAVTRAVRILAVKACGNAVCGNAPQVVVQLVRPHSQVALTPEQLDEEIPKFLVSTWAN